MELPMLLSAIQKSTLLDYPGKIATLVFTPGCNFRCAFCHNPEFVLPEKLEPLRKGFIPEEIFFRFLKTRQGFLDGVVICGGEPTIHADLPDFCAKIKELGFLVKLDTNGSRPDTVESLLDAGLVDFIAMDIKHPLERYSELTGRPNDAEAYRRSIETIMRKSPDYEFRTTVIKGRHTKEDMEEMTKSIKGAKKYFLQNYRSGNTLDACFEGESFTSEELEDLAEIARSNVSIVQIRN